ncbi:hypothetical protein [Massilia sp. GCM10023247]|uniref:hypothetical protein n=1 Tax=Massilia sp. GCM10023247 TaxID=3252643 RepID=UPI00361E36C3
MSALRDYGLLWRAALAIRHPRANAVLGGFASFCALAVGLLVLMQTGDIVDTVINGARAACAVLVFGWLMYFIPGAIKLNTPANAQLVPRMRRRLVQLTLLAWAGAVGLATLLAAGTPLGARVVFVFVGVWLIALGLARTGHPAGKAIQFLMPMLIILGSSVSREGLALLAGGPLFAVAALLVLALGAFTLEVMFPHGGERHYRLHAAQKQVSDQMSAAGQFRKARVPRVGRAVYLAAFRRDLARRNAGALLMHLLGPAVHWSQRLLPMAFLVGIAAGAMAIARQVASADTLEMIAANGWLAASSVLVVQVLDHERRLMRLSFTRGEQSLVRLVPSLPGIAGTFNRYLVARLLLAGLRDWATVSVAVLCVVALTGAPAPIMWMQAAICCLTLPLLASPVRDHARHAGAEWRFVLWQGASLGACFLAGIGAQRVLGTPVLPVAALASVALAAVSVAWRWRRLAGAPHAFPVGRLA